MKKLDSHIFDALTQLRSSEKQPNESSIMNILSEKLEELNIDKEQLTERLKLLVEYKKINLFIHSFIIFISRRCFPSSKLV